jgi:hypothetical protein
MNIIYQIVSLVAEAEIAMSNNFFHRLETGTLGEELV